MNPTNQSPNQAFNAQTQSLNQAPNQSLNQAQPLSKPKSRCVVCNKKISISDVGCRCNKLVCMQHRHPETHQCTFDYKSEAHKHLVNNNPKIVAAKFEKI